jgi:DNA-binding SARP family transcriptional activator
VLLDSLWPDRDPTSAVNNLHQALHIARRALAGNASSDGWLELRDDVVSLNADGLVDVDVRRFEQLAALARSSGNLTDLRAAVAAYTGDLLPEDRFEDWAARPREELRASSATSSSTSRTPSGRPGTRQRQSTRCSARSRPIHSTSVPSGA